MNQKVKFNGETYWLLLEPDGDEGPLAPLHHCDAEGNVLIEHCMSISFAHVYRDGRIMRLGEQIGTREDLEICQT